MFYTYFILLLSLFNFGNTAELNLRNELFNNYNRSNRPVINYADNVDLKFGIEVLGLNYFNQKAENIEFNILITQVWYDEYLKWELDNFNVNFIDVNSNLVWKPDLELYNSAKTPFKFNDNSTIKIYNDGKMFWTKIISVKFSCQMDLHRFPFDKQKCNLLFGSWKFTKKELDLKPFYNNSRYINISVSDKFNHNEWDIINTYVEHEDLEYLCCPGDLYPNSNFYIELKRTANKYTVSIIFSIFITASGLAVSFIDINIYRRTFVLVFVPLSIIWLQIYIADKIPIIQYSTLLEKIFLLCFSTTMALSLESALIYGLLTENYIPKKKVETKINDASTIKYVDLIKNNDFINKFSKIIQDIDITFRILLTTSFIIAIIVLLNT